MVTGFRKELSDFKKSLEQVRSDLLVTELLNTNLIVSVEQQTWCSSQHFRREFLEPSGIRESI